MDKILIVRHKQFTGMAGKFWAVVNTEREQAKTLIKKSRKHLSQQFPNIIPLHRDHPTSIDLNEGETRLYIAFWNTPIFYSNTITLRKEDAGKTFTLFTTATKLIRFSLELVETPSIASAQAPTPTSDIPTQIAKLAELHQAGVLTTEEFEAKKAELLARM